MVLTTYTETQAKDAVLDRIQANVTDVATGDDDTTPVKSQTDLVSETFRKTLVAGDYDRSVTDQLTISHRQATTENNSNDIDEVGGFDDPSAGNMSYRNTITTISKTSSINVYLDEIITVSIDQTVP